MLIRTSYFYQIRNFTRNMIPISTAVWDPAWYHNFTKDYSHLFYDSRNILNGLRLEKINEEIILVLIVYETPNNLCSERIPLQEYFTQHG